MTVNVMSRLKQLSEELCEILDAGLSQDNFNHISPTIIEWENDMGKFRYDATKETIFVQPRMAAQHLDLKVTILPTGATFEE